MKVCITLLAVLLGILGGGYSLPMNPEVSMGNLWPIPQKDGSVRMMTHVQALMEALLAESEYVPSERKMDKVRFFLYTRTNPTEPVELDMDDPVTLVRSPFDGKNPTRFVVHGWNGGYLGGENRLIREALLLNGEYNFIAVDWSVYGESNTYVTSQQRCSKAGIIIAEFIDWLHDNGGLSYSTLALYGHSLGAHVVGFAGRNVKYGKIHTIVGLDPAMPLFNYDNPETRLSESDAGYVESIHTNGGMLGFYQPIGQASFYPNGGKSQPGCGIDINGSCAHSRSVHYFSEALKLNDKNGFNSVACADFQNLKDSKCNLFAGGVRLGDPNNYGKAFGIYYLETSSQSPFALGNI